MTNKIFISFFICICSIVLSRAQTVSHQVIGATGGSTQQGNFMADWSVGGTAATSVVALPNGQMLTQGFLQPNDIVIQLILTFNPLIKKTYEDVDFILNAVASDGSPIDYQSSNTAVAIITNNTVKIVGAGNANITATIRGTTITKVQPLVVDKAAQLITFTIIPIMYKGDPGITMSATSNKGFPVTFTNSNPVIVTVNGNVITPLAVGNAIITAMAIGNNNYNDATAVAQLVQVETRAEPISVPLVLTPNDDGINDKLLIKNIENYPSNRVTIVNRNGVKIYSRENYDNAGVVFNGFNSNNTNSYLPQGSYFYSITYKDGSNNRVKTGWFVIKY